MARPKSKSAPAYRLHKSSGQARVIINRKAYYLGKFDSDESHNKYRRLIAEKWNAATELEPTLTRPDSEPTISFLAVEYAKHAKSYYRKNGKVTSEWYSAKRVLKELRSLYGSLPAIEFGPLAFKTLRRTFIDADLARSSINHYMFHVRKMFQFAAANELVKSDYSQRLRDVPNLIEGRSKARETDDILPVEDWLVDATLEKLTPVVSTMVQLQRLTGMRPGEVCSLRPCDVDRSNEVWFYKPPTHKNEHKKGHKAKTRIVTIGPKAQSLLTPFLLRDHQAFCFSPMESSRNGATRHVFDAGAYRVAVQRAVKRAFPIPKDATKSEIEQWKEQYLWSPNQLRHSAATLARQKLNLDTPLCQHA